MQDLSIPNPSILEVAFDRLVFIWYFSQNFQNSFVICIQVVHCKCFATNSIYWFSIKWTTFIFLIYNAQRINLVNQDINLVEYFKDFSKDEIQSEEEAIFYRFQKNCKAYTDIIRKFSEKNNENWITLENLPKSTINDKEYKLIKSASELYYFDYEGNKTIVKIENNNWIEYFIDESFSKLKLHWKNNYDFNLEFLEILSSTNKCNSN